MIVTINNYLVDFEAPIWMSENQRVKFIAFFKNLFSETKVINIKEPEKKVRYSERRIKHWGPKEYSLLFTPKTNEELAEELGRSEMSVNMQRAEFLPEFINWATSKGYKLDNEVLERLIKEFVENEYEDNTGG